MKKIETIWHHLLWQALINKKFSHTQQELAKEFGYSLSTIHLAVTKAADIGAVRIGSKSFAVENAKKLLYYWASLRNLGNCVRYSTYYEGRLSKPKENCQPEASTAATPRPNIFWERRLLIMTRFITIAKTLKISKPDFRKTINIRIIFLS